MPTVSRSSRARRTTALLGTLALLLSSAGLVEARGAPEWLTRLFHAATGHSAPMAVGDTVVVYGPKVFALGANSTSGTFVEQFTAPAGLKGAALGQAFIVRVQNGYNGKPAIASGTVKLNGVTVASGSFGNVPAGQTVDIPIPMQLTSGDVVQGTLVGPKGAALRATVLAVPDPTFAIFGPKLYQRASGTAVTVTDQFALPAGTSTPRYLCFRNGDADGTHRNSSVTVKLNNVEILGSTALNGYAAPFCKVVTFTANNTLAVKLMGVTGSRFTVTATATDASAPKIAITAPLPKFITRQTTLTAVGTVTDQTPVTVLVNGLAATLTAGTAGQTSFTATVPLTAEGNNNILIRATDAAGNRTDSTRVVIRDTEAPVVVVNGLPDSATYQSDSLVTVSGTINDRTKITANLNGQALVVDSTTHGFSKTIRLAAGVNFLTFTATDAAGNVTTVVRQLTFDSTPPTLTVTAPAEAAVTRESAAQVTGTVTAQSPVTVRTNGVITPLGAGGAFTSDVTLTDGANTITVTATNASGIVTTVVRHVVRDAVAPVVTLSSPSDNVLVKTATVTVTGTVQDASAVTATLNGVALVLGTNGAYSSTIALSEGPNGITVVATDAAGNTTSTIRTITLDSEAPVLVVSTPAEGATTESESVPVTGSVTDATAVHVTVNGAPTALGSDGAFLATMPLVVGANTLTVTATDSAGNVTTVTRGVTRTDQPHEDPTLPPNPRTVAPTLNRTVATTQATAAAFLYTGSNPIQTGVAEGTIMPVRAATLRGRVITPNGNALAGALVTVFQHPEFGSTKSRADGWYDLVVNGGGNIMVAYGKDGHLGAQRTINAQQQDYTRVDDVALVPLDAQVTPVQFGAATTEAQVARGSTSTDADGSRQATFVIDAGTSAFITTPDGATMPVSTLSLRITEFTVGANGRAAMPASLPATSGYTYAAEPTADEALAVGGTVTFDKPISVYVENFLGFPVGVQVPLGTYDRTLANWVAQPDGRVIKVVAVENGAARVDITGDGVAEPEAELVAAGYTATELAQLAVTYQPGATLMRSKLTRYLPFDANYPLRTLGVDPVVVPAPSCASANRDVVKCDVRNATQAVAVPGTPLTLAYTSARSAAAADRTLDIPVTGSVLPADLMGMYVRVTVAGQTTEQQFQAAPNVTYHYEWDGNDAYGRPVQGTPRAVVELGHRFPTEYQFPADVSSSFGLTCSTPAAPNGTQRCRMPQNEAGQSSERYSFWRVSTAFTKLGGIDAKSQGLGGFDFNVHHQYDPAGKVLYLGDGSTRVADAISPVITHVAGQVQTYANVGDDGPAIDAKFNYQALHGIAALPDGRYLIPTANSIRAVSSDGIIRLFAGTIRPAKGWYEEDLIRGPNGTVGGEGGPANDAFMLDVVAPVVGPDGTVYAAENHGWTGQRILRVSPDGILTRVAGGYMGGLEPPREGLHIHSVTTGGMIAMAIDAQSNLYLVMGNDPNRIYRLGADSLLHVVAGNGEASESKEGAQATQTGLYKTEAIAIGPDGSIYVAENEHWNWARVYRIRPDGTIHRFMGGGTKLLHQTVDPLDYVWYSYGSGPGAITVSADNVVYVNTGTIIVMITPDGTMRQYAGNGACCGPVGDKGPALNAQLGFISGLQVMPDGSLLAADYSQGWVWRVAAPMPGFSGGAFVVASEDGSELYSFDVSGRHLSTASTLTGAPIYTFTYDAVGRITGLRDRNGLNTTIERDGVGRPTSITGPYSHRTSLVVDESGQLAAVTPANGLAHTFVFSESGLLNSTANSAGQTSGNTYDADGKLLTSSGPGGSGVAMSIVPLPFGSSISVGTMEGVDVKLTYGKDRTGVRSAVRENDGVKTTVLSFPDGSSETRLPDGTVVKSTNMPDPRFGMQTPLTSTTTILPSGLTHTQRMNATVTRNPLDEDEINIETDSTIVNGRVTTATYDHVNQKAVFTTPGGQTRTLRMDDEGRVVSDSISGLAAISYDLSEDGFVMRTQRAGRAWTFVYDTAGRVIQMTNPLNRTTQYLHDANDNVSAEISPSGDTTFRSIDNLGRLTVLKTGHGRLHRLSYTADDHLARYTMPDAGDGVAHISATYDKDGKRTAIIRASGDTVAFAYDGAGRQTSVRSRQVARTFVFDSLTGLPKVLTDGPNGLALQFDGSLVTNLTLTGEIRGTVAKGYSNDLTMRSQTVNGGLPILFHYDLDLRLDSAGALSLVRDNATGFVVATNLGKVVTASTFTSVGSRASFSATVDGVNTLDVRYTRDSLDRVTRSVETITGDTTHLAYAYDPSGRLWQVVRDGQLQESYEYDANGNRSRAVTTSGVTVGTYDARDRLVSYGNTTYGYTPDGCLAFAAAGADTTRYVFTEMGDLRTVTLPGSRTVTYVTDALGRRIGKKVNGVLERGWIYDGQYGLVAEVDGNSAVLTRFVYGQRDDVPEYLLKGGRTYRLLTDQLGSVRLVVDVADGTIAQRITYDAFGRISSNTNPGFQPFAYAGGVFDEDTKLSHFGARDYDAATGRWISKDPILFAGEDANLYAYVRNDPVNMRDPSGHDGTLPETNVAMDTNEELQKDKTEQDLDNKDRAMKALCDLTVKLAATAQNAHHTVFKVFGGLNTKNNYIYIPRGIHMGFHGIVDQMLLAADLPVISDKAADWATKIQDPATRAQVKQILLAAATSFDTYCSHFSKSYVKRRTPGDGPQSMREVMEQYMADENW